MDPDRQTARRPTPIEKLLGVFTEVRAGEGFTAILLTLNVFLILAAYYLIKPVREALILAADDGAEWKSYAAAGQALLLLLAVPAYGWLASRVPRRRLINTVTVFFTSNLVIFYLLIQAIGAGPLALGLGFFLWVGVFNLMVPAQFWSFANDVYTNEQGKRLFVIVAFGASMGAVVGSWVSERLIGPLGLEQLLLVSGGLLLLGLVLTNTVESRQRREQASREGETLEVFDEPLAGGNAFALVVGTRYLLLIALLLMLLNWVNTTGEYILGETVKSAIAERAVDAGIDPSRRDAWIGERIGAFYADFFFWVNVLGAFIQLFLVSRILKYLGVRIAILILPVIALGAYGLLAFFPILSVVRWAKTAENATDYSLNNTVRQALFLPTTREEKYKAKQAIDTFFVRAGDVLQAVTVYVGLNVLTLSVQGFAVFNLVLVAVWLGIAVAIGREYRRLSESS